MVFKKLLAGLGFGGVEVDTILNPPSSTPGGQLTGQVQLNAKGDVEISAIQLLLVGGSGQQLVELARYPVAQGLRLTAGARQSVPFSVPTPPHMPVTSIYGKTLPGVQIGVRTEVAVHEGKAKTDFDPFAVGPTAAFQQVIDSLGAIGCRFIRNEVKPGQFVGLPAPLVQSLTFYAPVPEGQQVGPHIPQLTFTVSGDELGTTVIAELASRPGQGQQHRIANADVEKLNAGPDTAWIDLVDGWVRQIIETLGQAPQGGQGSFLQPVQHGQQPYGKQQPYGYGGHGYKDYKYGGYRRGGMGSSIAAGVGGAALGFFGGMIIGDMISDAFQDDNPDQVGAAGEDPGAEAADTGDAGYDDGGGYDSGGDFGGGDFGGDF